MTIMNEIKEQITSGKLASGQKLPSIRAMSDQFTCSKSTVIQAYNNLEIEKIIYSVPKSGYFVLHQNLSTDDSDPEIIDFATNNPDPSAIPHQDFYLCLNQAIELYKDEVFAYDEVKSFISLRKVIEKHLMNYQIFTNENQIFVSSGARQAFQFLNIMPFPNGKSTVLVEQPSFSKMLNSLNLIGVNVIGITRTTEGVDLDELENHFRNNNIKFFYTIPRNHPSLGTSYSMNQKRKIAELAKKYDIYIVEDDYIPDLEISKKADPIFSVDTSGHTIYIKSFSKILSPGLRLAIVVLPKNLVSTFKLYKNVFDRGPAALSQGAIEIFLTNGMFEQHVKRVRKEYQKRLEVLRETCNRYFPEELNVEIPKSGIYSIITFPDQFPITRLISTLYQNNVLVAPTESAFLKTYPKSNSIRVSILRTNNKQIKQGICMVGEISKDILTQMKTVTRR